MAELALAIIPIGLKTCSGLVSYLGGIKDRDDALARVARQAESLEGSFRLLDAFLKRSQLNPAISQVVDHAFHCLRSCEDGLKELRELQQKLSSPVTSDPKSKDKLKDGYRKLSYPLQQSQLEQLESTLDNLCTPLNLAIQNLQLEMQQSTSEHLDRNTTRIQQTNNEVSDISTAIVSLNSPISNIQSQFPVLQNSVDALVPQINLMMQAQLRTQMEEIKLSFLAAESAAVSQRNAQTNELLSKLRIDERNHDPAIYKLVSKPSALATVAGSVSACQCRARRLRTHRSAKLGPLYLKDDMVSNIRHYKSCDFNLGDPEWSRTLTITFNGLNRLINRAIEITLRTNRGAGAFGISPSITSFAVVDRMTAPSFQVINLIRKVYMFPLENVDRECFLYRAVRKLREIFHSGKTRPTDVDRDGNTLLHASMNAVGYNKYSVYKLTLNTPFTAGLQALVEFLITIGVPVDTVNSFGSLSLHEAAATLLVPASILRLLLVDNVNTPHNGVPSALARVDDMVRVDYSLYEHENPKIIEALFEPLGVDIIRTNVIEVGQMIQRCPEILEELNFNGETNCSLAVNRPEVLKVITRHATPAQLVQRNNLRWNRITPMGKAIGISKAICETQGDVDESLCPCVAAVKILLEADCPIIPSRDFWYGFRDKNLFSQASKHCKFLVVKELRTRRRGLRQVAKENLRPSEYSCLYSSEAELDYHAIELDSELRRKGFLSFGRLSAIGPSSESRSWMDTPLYSSVYSNLEKLEDASIFWNLGFRDIDIYSGVWQAGDKSKNFKMQLYFHSMSPKYSLWLVEHCPRFWELMCNQYEVGGPCYVLDDIIERSIFARTPFEQVDLLKHITKNLSKVEIANSCTCQCSPEGCTPFDLAVKWLARHVPWDEPKHPLLPLLFEDQGGVLDLNRHIIMIRQVTFEALDMIYTCIDRPDLYHDSGYEYDCVEEDVERARYLDDIVMEFQDFVLGEDTVVDHESSDASANGKEESDNQDTINYQRALEFWNEVWPYRMRDIKEELTATWNPDQKVLEDLGVSLWYEEEVDSDEELLTDEEQPTNGSMQVKLIELLEYWLDTI